MESLLIPGIFHVFGTLLWIAAIAMISLKFIQTYRNEKIRNRKKRFRLPVFLAVLLTIICVGSSGLIFLYEYNIWRRTALDFWWLHSMMMVWMLFGLTFFLIDPFLPNRKI